MKTQDAPFLLNRCIANRQNGAMSWEIVRRQWPELLERFPDNTIVRMVGSITTLTTPELVADVQGFFSEHPIPQAAKTLEQLLERQKVNAGLRAREAERLAAALADELGQLLDVQLVGRRGGPGAPSCRTCRRWSWAPRR